MATEKTRRIRRDRAVDLDAYAAWLKTEEAVRAFRDANQAADEDAEVFRRMNDIDPDVLNTPITR